MLLLRGPAYRGPHYATPHLGGGAEEDAEGGSGNGGRRMRGPARAGAPKFPGPNVVDRTPTAPPRVTLRCAIQVAPWKLTARPRTHELGLSLDLLLGTSEPSRWFYPDEDDKEPT